VLLSPGVLVAAGGVVESSGVVGVLVSLLSRAAFCRADIRCRAFARYTQFAGVCWHN